MNKITSITNIRIITRKHINNHDNTHNYWNSKHSLRVPRVSPPIEDVTDIVCMLSYLQSKSFFQISSSLDVNEIISLTILYGEKNKNVLALGVQASFLKARNSTLYTAVCSYDPVQLMSRGAPRIFFRGQGWKLRNNFDFPHPLLYKLVFFLEQRNTQLAESQ